MGHRPYPNAERALRQARRGRIMWVQPAIGGTPWLLPRVPEGWGDKAAENIRAAFAGLRQDRHHTSA